MTLAQHRMWEQANHHLNRGLEAIFATEEFKEMQGIKQELSKANEYDQLVWEELQVESLKYNGQYDQIKLLIDKEFLSKFVFKDLYWIWKERDNQENQPYLQD